MLPGYAIGVALGVIVTLYSLLEIHYFLRMLITLINARFFKRRVGILDDTSVHGVCLTTDVDTLLFHMNNVRYLREVDFARVDFYERTLLYRKIRAKGGSVYQGATTIRYRRFVRPFSRFKITSRIIYWNSTSIFMEHRFISPKDQFIHAIAICQQRVVNCEVEAILQDLLGIEGGSERPVAPLEVAKWIECNDISSANLRNNL